MKFSEGYDILEAVSIPNTNLLIVNTILTTTYSKSILYFIDWSATFTSQNGIRQAITYDSGILHMSYSPRINKLIISTNEEISFIQIPSFTQDGSISLSSSLSLDWLQDSNYAVIIESDSSLQLINVETLSKSTSITDNIEAFSSIVFPFTAITHGAILSNANGLCLYLIDLSDQSIVNKGQITEANLVSSSIFHRKVVKHSAKNLFFTTGDNFQIIVFEVSLIASTISYTILDTKTFFSGVQISMLSNIALGAYIDDSTSQLLFIGDSTTIYQKSFVHSPGSLTMDNTDPVIYKSSLSLNTEMKWKSFSGTTLLAIALEGQIAFLNTNSLTWDILLYFKQDGKTAYNVFESKSIQSFVDGNNVKIYQKGVYDTVSSQISLPGTLVSSYYNTNIVKGCDDCLFIKTISGTSHLALVQTIDTSSPSTTSYDLASISSSWSEIGSILDPFVYASEVWVTVAFPGTKSASRSSYLFQVINLSNSGTSPITLSANTAFQNQVSSQFALVDYRTPASPQIIGVDSSGRVRQWNLATSSIAGFWNLNSCYSSDNGVLFDTSTELILIVSCKNKNIMSLNLSTGSYTTIMTLKNSFPILKAFNSQNTLVIGDRNQGLVHLYTYSASAFQESIRYQYLKSVSETIVDVTMYTRGTTPQLWIQFENAHVFIDFPTCYLTSTCSSCSADFYFSPGTANSGDASLAHPFTSPLETLVALFKIQHIVESFVLLNTVNMKLNIDNYGTTLTSAFIIPPNAFTLSIDPSTILLEIKSSNGSVSPLLSKQRLVFSSYSSITLSFVSLLYFSYGSTFNSNNCGLTVNNVLSQSILESIKLSPFDSSSTVNCNSVQASASKLVVTNFIVSTADFTNSGSIFTLSNNSEISISVIDISSRTFGSGFMIVDQEATQGLIISSLTLDNNVSVVSTSTMSPLFRAGWFTASLTSITNNQLFQKQIFISNADSTADFTFTFNTITMSHNVFTQISTATCFFFCGLFYQYSFQKHTLTAMDSNFLNNSLNNADTKAQLFETSKVALINIQNLNLLESNEISIGLFESCTTATLTTISCENTAAFTLAQSARNSNGCVHLVEAQTVTITDFNAKNKKTINKDYLSILNQSTKDTVILVQDSSFSGLNAYQTTISSFSNPLRISSVISSDITITNCNFYYTSLNSHSYPLEYSTAGVFVENTLGTVTISHSTFTGLLSSSKYGCIYVIATSLLLQTVTGTRMNFQLESEFDPTLNISSVVGSFLSANIETLTIADSNFEKGVSKQGGFFFVTSFSQYFSVTITNSNFIEGFSFQDGAAFYVDGIGQNYDINISDSNFKHLYSFGAESATFRLKFDSSFPDNTQTITMTNGEIVNSESNNGICFDFNMMFLTMDTMRIYSEDFTLTSEMKAIYQKIGSMKPTLIFKNLNGEVNLINVEISNWHGKQIFRAKPAIGYFSQSVVTFDTTTITGCTFIFNALVFSSSYVFIMGSTFDSNTQVNNIQNSVVYPALNETTFSDFPFENSFLQINITSSLTMMQNTFSNIKCTIRCSGILSISSSNFKLSDNTFTDLESSYGGAIFIQDLFSDASIISSSFTRCNSYTHGGAIFLQVKNSQKLVTISSSSFTDNHSKYGRGGAIYIRGSDSSSTIVCPVKIIDSTISQNSAAIGGGIDSQLTYLQLQGTTTIINNSASIYGLDNISYPTKIEMHNYQDLSERYTTSFDSGHIVIEGFRSGASLGDIQAILMDSAQNIFSPITQLELENYSIYVQVSDNQQNANNYFVQGTPLVYYNSTVSSFSFSDLVLVGTPSSQLTLQLKSGMVQSYDETTKKFIASSYAQELKINFRACIAGEVYNSYSTYVECKKCAKGTFSFDQKQCYDCMQGATCNGGTDITINTGYWRSSSNSSIVIECTNQLNNCAGGTSGNQSCSLGHIGALCEECDLFGEVWGTSYTQSTQYSCFACEGIPLNQWLVIIGITVSMFSMTFSITLGVKQLKQRSLAASSMNEKNRKKNRMSFFLAAKLKMHEHQTEKKMQYFLDEEDKTAIYIKILMNYIQIVSSVATFKIDFSAADIFNFSDTVGSPVKKTLNSMDCFLKDMNLPGPYIYARMLFSMAIPVAYGILFIVLMSVLELKKPQKLRRFPIEAISTAWLFLIIYAQPDLVSQLISLISCRKIGDESYILSNVSYKCDTDEYSTYSMYLVLPLLGLWMILIPFFLFLALYLNRKQLMETRIKLNLGYLYKEYTSHAYYWEFIKMFEKIMIIFMLNYYTEQISVKAILVFIIITIYGVSSLLVKPYTTKDINDLDFYSTKVCAATVLLALFMYNNQYVYFVWISVICIAFINVWILLKLLPAIIRQFLNKFKPCLMSILSKLAVIFPFLKKYLPKEKKQMTMSPERKQKIREALMNFIDKSPQEKKSIMINLFQHKIKSQFVGMIDSFYDEEDKYKKSKSLQIKSKNLDSSGFTPSVIPNRIQAIDSPFIQSARNSMCSSITVDQKKDFDENIMREFAVPEFQHLGGFHSQIHVARLRPDIFEGQRYFSDPNNINSGQNLLLSHIRQQFHSSATSTPMDSIRLPNSAQTQDVLLELSNLKENPESSLQQQQQSSHQQSDQLDSQTNK